MLNGSQQVLRAIGFLAAAAESPGVQSDMPALLIVGGERAEALKLEAAARLAEALTIAQPQVAAVMDQVCSAAEIVRPEVDKISRALSEHRPRPAQRLRQVRVGYSVLNKSLRAYAHQQYERVSLGCRTFSQVLAKQLGDFHTRPRRLGLVATGRSYCRILFSSVCEACVLLKLDGRHRGLDAPESSWSRGITPNQLEPSEVESPELRRRRQSRRGRTQSPGPHGRGSSARRSVSKEERGLPRLAA